MEYKQSDFSMLAKEWYKKVRKELEDLGLNYKVTTEMKTHTQYSDAIRTLQCFTQV